MNSSIHKAVKLLLVVMVLIMCVHVVILLLLWNSSDKGVLDDDVKDGYVEAVPK